VSTDVIVRIVPGGCMAANQFEADKLDQFRGKEMVCTFTIPRNLKFHKKYMALINTALDMADTEYTAEQFRKICTIGAGYVDWFHFEGQAIPIPKSISFASMDDSEFERLYQDTITFICQKWVLDQKQLNQIVNFM
jgi:hypothetical protein